MKKPLAAIIFLFAGILLAASFTASTKIPAKTIKAGKIILTVEPAGFSRLTSNNIAFGRLAWRGGLEISSNDPRFGGFSGLALSSDGSRMVAISDMAFWFRATLQTTKGTLSGIANTAIAPIKIPGNRKSKYWRDSEGLAPWGPNGIDGKMLVGFERRERLSLYNFGKHGFKAKPQRLYLPKAVGKGPTNGELEAVGHFFSGPKKGWYLAIAEKNFDAAGNIRAWSWKKPRGKKRRQLAFLIQRNGDYEITGLAIPPDGQSFFTLERSISLTSLPGFAIRQFPVSQISNKTPATGKILFSGRQPFFALDNMEGIAVHKTADGKLNLTIISDDNYNTTLQKTLILRFEVLQKN